MADELQLISDDDGLAVIGDPAQVDLFLTAQGLGHLPAKDLDLHRLRSVAASGAAAVKLGSEVAGNSGRWVKLTAGSAQAVHKLGLTATKTPGVSYAMIGRPGASKQWLQIAQAPAALSGPWLLPALATMMSQQAMQQQMDEIVEYLAVIDEKIDDILQAQKDAVLAGMIGVDLILEEALSVREQVGRVSEVTWSKVQATSTTVATTLAYALRQLDNLAAKLEKKTDPGERTKATRAAEPQVRQWLAVLARCFQLQDGISILELDRVLDAAPEDLDRHRRGLAAARRKRLDAVSESTALLLERMDGAIAMANAKVLLNPFDSPALVRSSKQILVGLLDFRGRLGIESDHRSADAKPWGRAVAEVGAKAVSTSAEGLAAARRRGDQTLDHASALFRAVDTDGDGVPDRPRAAAAAGEAGLALKGAAHGISGAFGTLLGRDADGDRDDATAEPEAGPEPTGTPEGR